MRKDAVDVDALAYCRISLQLQLVPELRLAHENQCHGAQRVEFIIQKEAKFFNRFTLQKMGFIQNTDHFFILHTTDDLNLVLELAFCISTVKL